MNIDDDIYCFTDNNEQYFKKRIIEDLKSRKDMDDIFYIIVKDRLSLFTMLIRRRDNPTLISEINLLKKETTFFYLTFWINILIRREYRLRISSIHNDNFFIESDKIIWPDPTVPSSNGHQCSLPLINFHIEHSIPVSFGKLCIELSFNDDDDDFANFTNSKFSPLKNAIFEGAVDFKTILMKESSSSLRIHDSEGNGILRIIKHDTDNGGGGTLITLKEISLSYQVMIEHLKGKDHNHHSNISLKDDSKYTATDTS